MLKFMKKLICTLLCVALLLTSACAAQEPAADTPAADVPNPEAYAPEVPESTGEDEPVYLSQDSEEYRTLYTDNPIEIALDERFTNAMTVEDFEALSIDYCAAWKNEYHALMQQLIELYPDDAEELKGLRDYTDEEAEAAYGTAYSQHIYIDEDGEEQTGVAAVQSGNFAAAEVYKESTVLSILNDYREDTPYVFAYSGN